MNLLFNDCCFNVFDKIKDKNDRFGAGGSTIRTNGSLLGPLVRFI